ncbi:MAG: prolyl oligopeptidase family serine peptidase, partial [Candidatus Neomarinimicrobiota bacterium]|nr:prolyl oligopeptidase family serine peptidase [Candidatus Neomarinimicrobiota bacterium]
LVKIHGIPKLIDDGKSFPFITIAPQCPDEGYWDRPEYVRSLISLIKEIMKTYAVDKTRVYGTGLSMGGLGTLAIAIKEPSLFAAIIPVCGGADLKNIDRINQLPIWLFHGEADSVIPVENSLSIYDALKPINEHVFLTIYKGVGHDSWTETYENEAVYEWLLMYRK